MKRGDRRRQELLEEVADHLLLHGLQGARLRPMAAALGTSDRMLLHYFKDKEDLLSSALRLISDRLLQLLDTSRLEPLPMEDLLPLLAGMLKSPEIRPYLKLWLELAASATGQDSFYRDTARQLCESFYHWVAATLAVRDEKDRAAEASLAFATMEGFVLLDAIGLDSHISIALQGLQRR